MGRGLELAKDEEARLRATLTKLEAVTHDIAAVTSAVTS